ncbi:MAG: Flp pilus assembly protein CpaB [Anaeromyxobacteraceae bacterium]
MAEKQSLNAVLHKAADRKTRRAAVRAALFLGLAVVAAVGSAVLLTRYMEARTAAARVPTRAVMVAAVDLPVGTELRAEHLRPVDWPMSSAPEGAVSEAPALEGKVVSIRMVKGEPVLPVKLAGSGGGLSALLPPGMRAAAVRVDDVVGVAGFIHPGDTVDVIATIRHEGGNNTSSKVILQRIKVLAVGKELDQRSKSNEKVVQATVATLMVDAEESERLALAATQGKILLTLRSGADVDVVATRGVTPASLLATSAEVKPAAAPGAVRGRVVRREKAPEKTGEVVEILRGDLFEKRDFQQGGSK